MPYPCNEKLQWWDYGRTTAPLNLDGRLMSQRLFQELRFYPKHESIWSPHWRGTNTETLKQQRSIWEGDQEPMKRSVTD
jgi:hypothetical protein